MSYRFRRKRTLPFKLPFRRPPRWVLVTGAAYLALALAFALLLVGPKLASHAQPTTVPPGTVAVTPAPLPTPAPDEYIPVPAGLPSTTTTTTTSTDMSAGQP